MRILIVTHAPLQPEYGAAQMALNLARALRDRGHDAVAWSTEPLPQKAQWWNKWRWQRRKIESFITHAGPFDLIDVPSLSVTSSLAARARIVARSVQPDLLYLSEALRFHASRAHLSPKLFLAQLAYSALAAPAIIVGWRRADVVLCLGTGETAWMRARFPSLACKLATYLDAPSPEDQQRFAQIRARRQRSSNGTTRFLWIGRWTSHKGTEILLDFLKRRLESRNHQFFTLAGTGDAAGKNFSDSIFSSDRLRVIPSFSRTDLHHLLETHDAGLFTSRVEGWGLCLNEMLEAGMPVFATTAGGVPDLRPYFPTSLRPFPPPDRVEHPSPSDNPLRSGYFQTFAWSSIAESYESQALV